MPYQDHDIRLNGLTFHYREWGDAALPPMILLHGITSWLGTWDPIAEPLQDRFHIYALDQRGHGQTDWGSVYNPDVMASDLDAFVSALNIPPFTLIGHSMGAINSWTYLRDHPEMVTRLVLVDFGPDVAGSRVGAGVMTGLLDQRAQVFDTPEDAVATPQGAWSLIQREDGKYVWRYDALGLSKMFEGGRSEDEHWQTLANIQCPVLLVRGGDSTTLSQPTADRMATTIPACELVVIPGAGHMVPFEQPQQFVDTLTTHLDSPRKSQNSGGSDAGGNP